MVKINMGEVQDFGQLDRGTYHFAITEVDPDNETSDSSKHPGTQYWRATLTVQDGPKKGQNEWTTIMLPPYEPTTLKSILKATVGQHDWSLEDINEGEIEIDLDDPSFLLQLEFVANVRPQKDNKDFNNVSRFREVPEDWGDEDSLLPS